MYISYSSPRAKATNTSEGNHRRIILAAKTGSPIIAAHQFTLGHLCSPLHLVIPLNGLLIRRRHPSLSALPSRPLLPLLLRGHGPIPPLLLRSSHIAPLPLLPQTFAAGLMVHVVVGDAAAAAAATATALALVAGGHDVVSVVVAVAVVVVGFGVEGDDVPGVEEAGDVAEGAEEDVDEGVGGADAGFDPDGDGGEEDGEEAEEDVAAAHCFFFLFFFWNKLGRWMLPRWWL